MKSPIALGYQDPNLAYLMSRYVLDVSTRRYFDVANGKVLDYQSFNDLYRHLVNGDSPHVKLTSNELFLKVMGVDYDAGNDDKFLQNDDPDNLLLNVWSRGGVEPEVGDCKVILDHIEYLIPDEEQRQHLLDCLAYSAQHPGEKIAHVLVIIGAQGTGKSFLGRLLTKIFGSTNTRVVESRDLIDEWTANLGNCQVLIVEELNTFEKMDVYNKLKTLITEPTIWANQKNIAKYPARTPNLLVAYSNHGAPIALEEGDRRFWICESATVPRHPEYYAELFSKGLGEQVP